MLIFVGLFVAVTFERSIDCGEASSFTDMSQRYFKSQLDSFSGEILNLIQQTNTDIYLEKALAHQNKSASSWRARIIKKNSFFKLENTDQISGNANIVKFVMSSTGDIILSDFVKHFAFTPLFNFSKPVAVEINSVEYVTMIEKTLLNSDLIKFNPIFIAGNPKLNTLFIKSTKITKIPTYINIRQYEISNVKVIQEKRKFSVFLKEPCQLHSTNGPNENIFSCPHESDIKSKQYEGFEIFLSENLDQEMSSHCWGFITDRMNNASNHDEINAKNMIQSFIIENKRSIFIFLLNIFIISIILHIHLHFMNATNEIPHISDLILINSVILLVIYLYSFYKVFRIYFQTSVCIITHYSINSRCEIILQWISLFSLVIIIWVLLIPFIEILKKFGVRVQNTIPHLLTKKDLNVKNDPSFENLMIYMRRMSLKTLLQAESLFFLVIIIFFIEHLLYF